ncbi:MAG TPA: hypothetical protein VJX66_01345, partial [Amycolatopsis sp.]|nr:hypothetical protein [Amycolatopsis sp.]
KVRESLTKLRVRYVFVGKGKVTLTTRNSVGLLHLDSTPGFKQVFQNDKASIYEIEGQQGVVTAGAATGSDTAHGK